MSAPDIWAAREELINAVLGLLQARVQVDLHPEVAWGSDHVDYCESRLDAAAFRLDRLLASRNG